MQANHRLSNRTIRLFRPFLAILVSMAFVSNVFAASVIEGSSWEAFAPPADECDWIQLTSNEWLKGDIKVFLEEQLEFDSDHFGVINIDYEDVKRLRGYSLQAIRIDDHEPIVGQLKVTETQVCPSSNKWDRCLVLLRECFAHHFHVTRRVVGSAIDVPRWSFV